MGRISYSEMGVLTNSNGWIRESINEISKGWIGEGSHVDGSGVGVISYPGDWT